jgi:hypothetical protein
VTVENVSTAAKTYLSAIGAVAIFICVDKGKPVNIGVARDLDKALRHLRKIISPTAAIDWAAWGMNYAKLAEIAQLRDLLYDYQLDGPAKLVPLDEIAVRITMMATAKGCVLTPHSRALERAETYAGYLDKALEGMQRNGTFAAFNQAYKEHRLELVKRNEPVQPYWAVMAELRAVIIRSLVNDPRNRLVPSSMLVEIRQAFPWFTKPPLIRMRKHKRKGN